MNKVEEKIRRNLAGNLWFLEEGLRLVEEEYKLPNSYGSKGFIDILAVDQNDQYVIIEIKRSNQAARQALHELFKYPSLLQFELGVKRSEMRVMLVSTEWSELLVPFSGFLNTSDLDVKGYKLVIDDEANPVSSEMVIPIELPMHRALSRNHTMLLYFQESSVEENIERVKEKLEEYGLCDFVVLHMASEKDIMHPFAIYIAHQRYSEDTYIRLLQERLYRIYERDEVEELLEEILDYKSDCSEEEYITYLEESLLAPLVRELNWDTVEIGEPEKLASSLSNGWQIHTVRRGGIYAKDGRLRDETIVIDELLGLAGINFESYLTQCHSTSRAKMKEITEELDRFLEYSPAWKAHIMSLLDRHKGTPFRFSLFIYNPGNILESLWWTIKHQTKNSLPQYQLIVDAEDESKTYIYDGYIKWDGTEPQFSEIMKQIYRHDFFEYWVHRHDAQLRDRTMRLLGFSYETNVVVLEGKSTEEFSYKFVEHKFDIAPPEPAQDAYSFVNQSSDFMSELKSYFDSHMVTM